MDESMIAELKEELVLEHPEYTAEQVLPTRAKASQRQRRNVANSLTASL